MSNEASGDPASDDLAVLLAAKNEEIQMLKEVIVKLQMLLWVRKGFHNSSSHDFSSSAIPESSWESPEKSEEANCKMCLCRSNSYPKLGPTCDVETQTFETDFMGVDCTGSAEDWKPPEGSDYTVADLVKQAVEEAVPPQSDYIYDENYKMYYSPSTGYYYDTERNLLYDPHSSTYYSYDSQSNTYEFYYQVTDENDLPASSSAVVETIMSNVKITSHSEESTGVSPKAAQNVSKSRLKKRNRKAVSKKSLNDGNEMKNEYVKTNPTIDEERDDISSAEEGELEDTGMEESGTASESSNSSASSLASTDADEDSSESWPPCIRLIVEESQKLQIGSLLLITCTGALIGRTEKSSLCIPETSVSKAHAEMYYDNETCQYFVTDLGSQNGTFINDMRLSKPKEKSSPYSLKHGDHLCFGSCKLLIHIHSGSETCDECEPGQVQAKYTKQCEKTLAVNQSKEEREKERRRQLRQLKKKYGLQSMNYVQDSTLAAAAAAPSGTNYQDRAKERQKTKGSDNPYEKTEQPTSLETVIPSNNKGFQLLKKMGWKEGEALGTKPDGKTEPVAVKVRPRRAGLGSGPAVNVTTCEDRRNRKWRKAQKRYHQILEKIPRSPSEKDENT